MNIHFEKASVHHVDMIFKWLSEPHMMEFWDNTQEHKDDILNFIHGRKQHYLYGTTMYWIGSVDEEPFSFLLSDIVQKDQDLSAVHLKHLSDSGHTICLDFAIGDTAHLGKGLAAPTLKAFVNFYHTQIDPLADTFFIDPDENNPRAKHVYGKAGFEEVGKFVGQPGAKENVSYLMVKRIGCINLSSKRVT